MKEKNKMPQYFTKQGKRISEDEAKDERGIVRDGVIVRTRLTDGAGRQRFVDARKFWNAERDPLVITDAGATATLGNRPGWRVADAPINRDARLSAYQDAEEFARSAWRTGFGTKLYDQIETDLSTRWKK